MKIFFLNSLFNSMRSSSYRLHVHIISSSRHYWRFNCIYIYVYWSYHLSITMFKMYEVDHTLFSCSTTELWDSKKNGTNASFGVKFIQCFPPNRESTGLSWDDTKRESTVPIIDNYYLLSCFICISTWKYQNFSSHNV